MCYPFLVSSIDFDPRVRHTVWGLLIGGFFNSLPNCCNQPAVQRICSMKSILEAQMYFQLFHLFLADIYIFKYHTVFNLKTEVYIFKATVFEIWANIFVLICTSWILIEIR